MKPVLVILLGLFLTACGQHNERIRLDDHYVIVGDPVLAHSLHFYADAASNKQHKLHASVWVESKVNIAMNLQYRFYWYDAQGLNVRDENTSWQSFTLTPEGSQLLQGEAAQTSATYYRVSIRKAEHVFPPL